MAAFRTGLPGDACLRRVSDTLPPQGLKDWEHMWESEPPEKVIPVIVASLWLLQGPRNRVSFWLMVVNSSFVTFLPRDFNFRDPNGFITGHSW